MLDMGNINKINEKKTINQKNTSSQASSPKFYDPNASNLVKEIDADQVQEPVPKRNKDVGFISSVSISEDAKKLGKPLNIKPKEEPKKISFNGYLFLLINYIKNTPKRFSSDLTLNQKSFIYSVLGTMIGFAFAVILFPDNPGIFAVFFITLFLAPFIIKQVKLNELLVGRTEEVKSNNISLFKLQVTSDKFKFSNFYNDHKKLFATYFYFFLGILTVIILLIAVIPQHASSNLFSDQGWDAKLIPSKNIGFSGQDKNIVFWNIFINNLSVLIVCFIIALVFPLGAILLIVWNAIYWGVVFTQYALFYSTFYNVSFISIMIPLLLSISVHIVLEIFAYFLASMSGNILAVGIKKEQNNFERLMVIIRYSVILLVCALVFFLAGALAEVYIFDILKSLFFSIF